MHDELVSIFGKEIVDTIALILFGLLIICIIKIVRKK